MPALSFAAAYVPLIFDQASWFQIQMTPKDEAGNIIPYAGHGIRLWFFVDETAVLLLLTVGNGKIVVSNTAPTIVCTFLATDTAFGTPMNGVLDGRWNMYDDPSGVDGPLSTKITGGGFHMNPLGPDTP